MKLDSHLHIIAHKQAIAAKDSVKDSVVGAHVPLEIWQHIFLLTHEATLPLELDEISTDPLSWGLAPPSSSLPETGSTSTVQPKTPLLLSHVCQSWRRLALHTPDMWNKIYIRVRKPKLDRTTINSPLALVLETQASSWECESAVQCLQAYLLRSRTLPLKVVLEALSNPVPATIFLRLLLPHSKRWHSIHLSVPLCTIAHEWVPTLKIGDAPLLTSLKLHERGWRTAEVGSELIDERLVRPFMSVSENATDPDGNAPSTQEAPRYHFPVTKVRDLRSFDVSSLYTLSPLLRRLSITTYPMISPMDFIHNTPWTSPNLTHLHVCALPSETNTIHSLLSQVQHTLEVLLLDGVGITRDDLLPPPNGTLDYNPPTKTMLTLPSLHTLTLTHPSGRTPLLTRLALPSLKALVLAGRSPSKLESRRLCVAIRRATLYHSTSFSSSTTAGSSSNSPSIASSPPYYTSSGGMSPLLSPPPSLLTPPVASPSGRVSQTRAPVLDPFLSMVDVRVEFEACPSPYIMFASAYGEDEGIIDQQTVLKFLAA